MTECPNTYLHYPKPDMGYLATFAWLNEMSKTHDQTKCPGCGLYEIWTPKKPVTTTSGD